MYVYSDGIKRASFKPLMQVCRVHLFITNQPSGPLVIRWSEEGKVTCLHFLWEKFDRTNVSYYHNMYNFGTLSSHFHFSLFLRGDNFLVFGNLFLLMLPSTGCLLSLPWTSRSQETQIHRSRMK